ncbi:MAG: UPF0182 family protein [Nocardioidaceae bacterium]
MTRLSNLEQRVRRQARAGASKRRATLRGVKHWGRRLLVAAVVVAVLGVLLVVANRIATSALWFDSVRAGSVYSTMIKARIVLFAVFAVIAGLIGGLTFVALLRIKPRLAVDPDDDTIRWTFRKYESRVRGLLLLAAVVVPAVLVGSSAASGTQTYLLWRHATPWHASDPQFHKDISFFVEVLPFRTMVVTLLSQALSYALWIALVGGYWYGGWRLRRGGRKIARGMTRLMSVLGAGYLVLAAARFWLSRYALTTSQRGPVTGVGYTDAHVGLPALAIMAVIALLGAVALAVNAARASRLRVLAGVVALVLVAGAVIGSAVPSLVYRFREAPSAAKVDLPEIAHNQKATLAAFGLDGHITTKPYDASSTLDAATASRLARTTAQIPVIDPNIVSPTFNAQQQLQAYYGFKKTLDVGRYDIAGRSQDVVLGARELTANGIPHPSWVKTHLVYTHGYGVVAAPSNVVKSSTNSPAYLNGGMPPGQQIPVTRPQVYFGQAFGGSSYSIVGQPAGSRRNLELDHPGGSGASHAAFTTYRGNGGIPIGSPLRRLMFALKLHDPNILFSSELNSASQLLTVRDPRARVSKVAPWLTLDGDVYPAVVDGRIQWVVDGYTTSAQYPNSQLVNFHAASRTTLTDHGSSVVQASQQVNYVHNSVKAVVDAYTGKVSLYEWNQHNDPDPLLKAWESVFPGLVQPQARIPAALLPQLRYPADLFNVQRTLLAKYSVTDPAQFYSGNDFWAVPNDPTIGKGSMSGGSGSSTHGTPATPAPPKRPSSSPMPSNYISLSADGYGAPRFSLSSPMVTLNGRQLASFISVDSEPGPDYGKFTVLTFPDGSAGGESPVQVENDIESNTAITEALTLQRGGNSRVVLGGLQAIPVGGRLLYVQPVYTRSTSSTSFPVLRHVIALYDNGDPSFEDTLTAAVQRAIASGVGSG